MRLAPILLIAASFGLAATPDFTGSWKLNSGKSSFGDFPAPSSMTQKVTHADPKMTVELKMVGDMGEIALNATYSTDGKETTNTGFGGAENKSVAKWDGEILLIDTKGTFGDTAFTMNDKWTLGPDGKTMTIQRHFASSMGELNQKIVLDKQ
jgi:hypothetical protein